MCGLAGILSLTGQVVQELVLKQMIATLKHRGPDDSGLWVNHSIGLAHQRLSILDLTTAGHQPMSNKRGDLWLIYNGEIYNYIELRQELEAKGHHFKTQTDTEVILAAYEEYGVDCLKHFNGMWAFALWDKQQEQLFCARDRFGIKPFYYSLHQNQLLFASEAKALYTTFPNLAQPNASSVYHYLTTGITDHCEQTFFQEIYQLKAGHYFIVNSQSSQIVQKPYWYLPEEIPTSQEFHPEDRYRELLSNSIKLRLRSDVPIGTCLSGGLDSSSIVCLAKNIIAQEPNKQYNQHTFSSCFEHKNYDERSFIEQVLQHTDAQPHYIFPDVKKLERELSRLIYHQDEPFGSLSIFAQYCVMEKVKTSGIKVILDGQGADEALAGYGYDGLLWADLLRSGNFKALFGELQAANVNQSIKRLIKMLLPSLVLKKTYQANLQWLDADFISNFQRQSIILQQPFSSHLKNQLYNLFFLRLPALLRYEDRNSMAFSIESRLPFLDYRLISFTFSLLESALIHQGWSKWVLRKSMTGVLPESIQWRKDKMGFVTPQVLWFKNELKPLIEEIIHSNSFQQRPFWNSKKVQQSLKIFLAGKNDALNEKLWRFINLELWLMQLEKFKK